MYMPLGDEIAARVEIMCFCKYLLQPFKLIIDEIIGLCLLFSFVVDSCQSDFVFFQFGAQSKVSMMAGCGNVLWTNT